MCVKIFFDADLIVWVHFLGTPQLITGVLNEFQV